jgi:Clustered mitochondria
VFQHAPHSEGGSLHVDREVHVDGLFKFVVVLDRHGTAGADEARHVDQDVEFSEPLGAFYRLYRLFPVPPPCDVELDQHQIFALELIARRRRRQPDLRRTASLFPPQFFSLIPLPRPQVPLLALEAPRVAVSGNNALASAQELPDQVRADSGGGSRHEKDTLSLLLRPTTESTPFPPPEAPHNREENQRDDRKLPHHDQKLISSHSNSQFTSEAAPIFRLPPPQKIADNREISNDDNNFVFLHKFKDRIADTSHFHVMAAKSYLFSLYDDAATESVSGEDPKSNDNNNGSEGYVQDDSPAEEEEQNVAALLALDDDVTPKEKEEPSSGVAGAYVDSPSLPLSPYDESSAGVDHAALARSAERLLAVEASAHEASAAGGEGERHWNREFQAILDATSLPDSEAAKLSLSARQQMEIERGRALRRLGKEFLAACEEVVTVLVQESGLAPESPLRKFPPANVGGVAGGTKFVARNILFKFATNMYCGANEEAGTASEKAECWLYPSIGCAMKAMNAELRGAMALMGLRVRSLHFPLIALCDIAGFRVMCSSLLPIDASTLRFGSSDGGQTFHRHDAEIEEGLSKCAEVLNLRPHSFRPMRTRPGTEAGVLQGIPVCVDIEGHRGRDGLAYIIDPARVFPPTPALQSVSGRVLQRQFLWRHFRAEFMARYCGNRPISSDALSRFGCLDADRDRTDVDRAFRKLVHEVIPAFAVELRESESQRSQKHTSGVVARDMTGSLATADAIISPASATSQSDAAVRRMTRLFQV